MRPSDFATRLWNRGSAMNELAGGTQRPEIDYQALLQRDEDHLFRSLSQPEVWPPPRKAVAGDKDGPFKAVGGDYDGPLMASFRQYSLKIWTPQELRQRRRQIAAA